MSFGPNLSSGYRMATMYTSRILRGAKPANIPVLQPNKFNLVINSTTVQALGLSIPNQLLASASQLVH